MTAERLPADYAASVEAICLPLAQASAELAARQGRPVIVGLCGTQASGKSATASVVARLLGERGLSCARLSLDDLYLTREERRVLAARVHPLLRTRGPPGTHDVALGEAVLDALARPGPVLLPRFDKGGDTRKGPAEWEPFAGPADVTIFEGWCVGARPQNAAALVAPVNMLEAEEDAHGVWREFVNAELAGPYQVLYGRIDMLAMLQAPGFETVLAWRIEQEGKLRARTPDAPNLMSESQIARFIAHYERLTRHILAEMPARAEMVFRLDERRRPIG